MRRILAIFALCIACSTAVSPSLQAAETPETVYIEVGEAVIKAYMNEGYSRLEVLNAALIAHGRSLPIEEVFALREKGLTWEQVKTEVFSRNAAPADGCLFVGFGEKSDLTSETGMTRDEVCRWTAKGYSIDDVLMANEMILDWAVTVEQALAMRKEGKDWPSIEKAFPRKKRLWFNERDVTSTTGLSVDAIRTLVKQGYNHNDLFMANGFAKERGKSLEAILQEFDAKGRDWSAYQSGGEMKASDVPLNLNISLKEVEAWVKKGAKPIWMLIADRVAKTEGRPFAEVLEEMIKNNGRRKVTRLDSLTQVGPNGQPQVVERTRSGLTLDQVNQLMKEFIWYDIDMADQWAVRLGVSALRLLEEKRKGRTWEEILAKSYADEDPNAFNNLFKALGVPQSTEITITKVDYDKLVASGFSPEETAKAALIAKALGRPVLDVAKLKTSSNTWLDVIALLKKRP